MSRGVHSMAGPSVTKLNVACWKQITCVYCGCQFRRRVTATMKGRGATIADAEADATEIAVAYLQQRADVWPCPHCGKLQPEMVGARRLTWHVLILLASFAWVGPF